MPRVEDFTIPVDVSKIDYGNKSLKNILGIVFELSNTCNYAKVHKECPVSQYRDKAYLDDKIFKRVVKELSTVHFDGSVKLHRYCEPMIDKKRFFRCVKIINKKLPAAKLNIWTNGSFLFQEDINRLEKQNIWYIHVTAYTDKEYERLTGLVSNKIPYMVSRGNLDNRLEQYTRGGAVKKPCYATIRDVTVNCYGQVSICCLDWDNKVIFGDLRNQSLEDIVNSPNFIKASKELINGERTSDLCRGCTWQR